MGKTASSSKKAVRAGRVDIPSALFTSTQFKLLQLLFGRADRSYYASELIALAKSGSGAVQREIARLVESGLVTQRDIGRQRHLQANAESPVFHELREIVTKTAGVPESVRLALEPLADRIGLALIYGSIARGEAHAASDVDLLVVGDGIMLEELHSSLESAETKLRRKISPTLYSRAEFTRRRRNGNAFLQKVLAGDTVHIFGKIDDVEVARQSRANRQAEGRAGRTVRDRGTSLIRHGEVEGLESQNAQSREPIRPGVQRRPCVGARRS